MTDCFNNCYDNCYHYDSQSGVYEGRAYCRIGKKLNRHSECNGYLDKNDKKGILSYKFKVQLDRIDKVKSLLDTEINYAIEIIKELKGFLGEKK